MANPKNATTTAKGRTYKWRGESFDSVTTILSGGVPKPALTNWAAKSVAQYVAENLDTVMTVARKDPAAAIDLMKGSPWRTRDAAADLGSKAHEWAEAHVLGLEPVIPPELKGHAEQFRRFLLTFSPVYEMAEASVYNRRFSYAGTLDAVVVIGGTRYLLDTKTGKGIYPETALQLAAYRYAEFVGMPNGDEMPMPQVDACAVLHLRPKSWALIPVRAGEDELRYFRYAQQVRNWCNDVGTDAIGAPLGAEDLSGVLAASVGEAVAS